MNTIETVTPVAEHDARLLRDDELDTVSGGGNGSVSEIHIQKLVDVSSPKLA